MYIILVSKFLYDKDFRHDRVMNCVEARSSYLMWYFFLSVLNALKLREGIQRLQRRVVERVLIS